jgi:type III secretory pathway component EscT
MLDSKKDTTYNILIPPEILLSLTIPITLTLPFWAMDIQLPINNA